jgi:glycosyltransferase involved in cell wall biosynthesis
MRIGINALAAENRSGTGRYTFELIRHLARIDSENQYVLVVHNDSPLVPILENAANFRLLKRPRTGRLARILWEQRRLPALIRDEHLSVYHSPAFVLPGRSPAPMVATIHDLVFMRYPETFGIFRRNYFHWAIPRSAYRAARLIADSEATRRDIEDLLQIPPARIAVVPLGVGEEFFEPAPPGAEERARAELQLPEDYILTVGTIEPRKNIVGLLQAYAVIKKRLKKRTPALVIVGRKGWKYDEVFQQIAALGLRGDVVWTDFLVDDVVRFVYQKARLFVALSLHEGFGLPLLEAMASGAAVVASNRSSFPEVVGDAGLLVNPLDVDAVADAMAGLIQDERTRADLAARARDRARTFSWERTARETLAVYGEAARKAGAEC